jgi:hypothetical protein
MHILGARFESDQRAFDALRELRARFDLGDGDAEVRPLGSTEYEEPTSGLILAGRFRSEVLDDVTALLEHLGGSVFVDREDAPLPVDTAWDRVFPDRGAGGGAAADEVPPRRASASRDRRDRREAREGAEAFRTTP